MSLASTTEIMLEISTWAIHNTKEVCQPLPFETILTFINVLMREGDGVIHAVCEQ